MGAASRLGRRANAVRTVVRRSFGRSACGRTPAKRAPFALTLRAPEDGPHRLMASAPRKAYDCVFAIPGVFCSCVVAGTRWFDTRKSRRIVKASSGVLAGCR